MRSFLIVLIITTMMNGCSSFVYVRSYDSCSELVACLYTIKTVIENNWRVPPEAIENNLEVTLRINLDNDKVVSNIAVTKSSGNNDFDQSAIEAVRQAKEFRELNGLRKEIFEKELTQFSMRFKP